MNVAESRELISGKLPPPLPFPPAFAYTLDGEGLKAALLLVRKRWKKVQFDAVLQALGLMEPEADLAVFDKDVRQKTQRERRSYWYRKFSEHKALCDRLAEFAERRAKIAGYSALGLMVADGRRVVYEVLLEMIRCLGVMSALSDPKSRGIDSDLLPIAWLLGQVSRADCWTVYKWDEYRSESRLVGHSGIWYPEACVGGQWLKSVVWSTLQSNGYAKAIEKKDYPDSRNSVRSGFVTRESVRRAWVVRLTSACGPAVVFLNWRNEGVTGPDTATAAVNGLEEMKPLLPDVDWRRGGTPAQDSQVESMPCVTDPRDLELATWFASGWMANNERRCTSHRRETSSTPSWHLPKRLVACFQPWLERKSNTGRVRLKLGAIRELGQVVHECFAGSKGISAEVLSCTPDGSAIINDIQTLVDWRGRPVAQGQIPIVPGPGGLVQEGASLLAQSIAWQTSIFLPQIKAAIPEVANKGVVPPGPSSKRGSLLHRRLAGRTANPARSEIAVPIFAGRQPIGGLTVEASGVDALSDEHLKRLEIVSLCTGNLFELCTGAASQEDRAWLAAQFNQRGTDFPKTSGELLKRFADYVRNIQNADVVHFVQPGLATGHLRSVVAAVSEGLCNALCDSRHIQRLPFQIVAAAQREDPEQAVADTWSLLFVPRNDGLSRAVLAGKLNMAKWEAAADCQHTLVHELLKGAMGTPVCPHESASPLGVLWTAWRHAIPRGANSKPTLQRIDRLSRVVASLYAGYRIAEQASLL